MVGGYRKVEGGYEGVLRDLGYVAWHCGHVHEKPSLAADCAWDDLRRTENEIDRRDTEIERRYLAGEIDVIEAARLEGEPIERPWRK